MKRSCCLLLIFCMLLGFSACGPAASGKSETDGFSSPAASVPAMTESNVDTTFSFEPSEWEFDFDKLPEEEQIAMWMAVIEELSKEDLTQEQALSKARSGLELLETCGEELLALELPEHEGSMGLTRLSGSWMVLYSVRSKTLTDFESQSCQMLLELALVEDITVYDDYVCFSIGGSGFGPETDYYDVYYVPSEEIRRCLAYPSDLEYEARDGGWFARANGDDTVFYQQLGEHLYFVAEHF